MEEPLIGVEDGTVSTTDETSGSDMMQSSSSRTAKRAARPSVKQCLNATELADVELDVYNMVSSSCICESSSYLLILPWEILFYIILTSCIYSLCLMDKVLHIKPLVTIFLLFNSSARYKNDVVHNPNNRFNDRCQFISIRKEKRRNWSEIDSYNCTALLTASRYYGTGRINGIILYIW